MPRLSVNAKLCGTLFLALAAITLPGQTPVLRSTTQLVEIDTVATDAHGKPVTDLKSSEFRVYEDGVERPLSHFSYENVQPIDAQAEKRFHDLAGQASWCLCQLHVRYGNGAAQWLHGSINRLVEYAA